MVAKGVAAVVVRPAAEAVVEMGLLSMFRCRNGPIGVCWGCWRKKDCCWPVSAAAKEGKTCWQKKETVGLRTALPVRWSVEVRLFCWVAWGKTGVDGQA